MQAVERFSFGENDPLRLYRAAGDTFGKTRALLHASAHDGTNGRFSYLGCDPAEMIDVYDPQLIKRALSSQADAPAINAYFGYIGYETLRHIEPSVPVPRKAGLRFPDICLIRFRRVYMFDHLTGEAVLYADPQTRPRPLMPALLPGTASLPAPAAFTAHMPDGVYLRNVARVLEHIRAGDIFQANITRKFSGHYRRAPDPAAIYRRLCAASPSPVGALLETPFGAVLSSSPETFLTVDAARRMYAAPIKGSAPRSPAPEEDARIRAALTASEKDRAENIMIADLYRNDFSRSCMPGSVRAPALCRIESFRTVHHLVSEITGALMPGVSAFEAVMRAFPPGSMTGAPKHEAMRICARYENIRRGVYSGVLGMFGGDGSAALSVVIRTIVMRGKHVETQSGGGIVADSVPEKELEETRFKLRGVAQGLGMRRGFP